MSSQRSGFDYWCEQVRAEAWKRHNLVLTPDLTLMQALFEAGVPAGEASDRLCATFYGAPQNQHLYRPSGRRS